MLSISTLDLKGKSLLIREDFNVPLKNNHIVSDARIKSALPTIQLALKKGAKVIVMSHLNRPTEGTFTQKDSLAPIAKRLEELLNFPVHFISEPLAFKNLHRIQPTQNAVLLLENVRFNIGETSNDDQLAKMYAHLCDIFVMDAFACAHRSHASTVGVARYAPIACAGLLLSSESKILTRVIQQAKKPILAIVGGAKVSSKLTLLHHLLGWVDHLILGGGIANTFMLADGHKIGTSLVEKNLISEVKYIQKQADLHQTCIAQTQDTIVSETFSNDSIGTLKVLHDINEHDKILDLGERTVDHFCDLIQSAKTIIWNGPLGVFEYSAFSKGTERIANAIANSNAFSIVGGGDTIAAIEKFGVQDDISYISTGGGAFLAFLEGKVLPAVAILTSQTNKNKMIP
jgi:phosphoglycerate kinase